MSKLDNQRFKVEQEMKTLQEEDFEQTGEFTEPEVPQRQIQTKL